MTNLLPFDELWHAYYQCCQEAGAHGCLIGGCRGDWQRAKAAWLVLDGHQRMEAVRGIRERVDRGLWEDAVLRSLPHTVLYEHKWERPFTKPARPAQTQIMSYGDERLRNA